MEEATNITTDAPETTPVPEIVETPETTTDTEKVVAKESEPGANKDKEATKVTEKPRLIKVKIDGKEEEVTEAELIRGYSHASAANKKFQEAAMTRKQAEAFVDLLKTDPAKLLKDPRLGIKWRELAESILLEEMEKEQMTPEQRELAETKRKLSEYEENKKKQDKAKQEAEAKALTEKYTDQYSKDIVDTLKKSSLPQSEHTVKRMAYYLYQGLTRGYDLKAIDVVDLVKKDYIAEGKALYGALDAETLIEMLGPEIAEKISKHNIGRIKTVGNKVTTQGQKAPGEAPPVKKLSKEEWRAKLAKIEAGND